MKEFERQRLLVDAIMGASSAASSLSLNGLQAYRTNAHATAERALRAVFPTVRELVGEQSFEHLACEHFQQHPPLRGDLGEWGERFPAWIDTHPALSEWPYLGDCARLDLACHRCERAADAVFDAASLQRLGDTDPAQLRLIAMPGLKGVDAQWPVVTILQAHRRAGPADFDAARTAISARRGEFAVVTRHGFRADVALIDAPMGRWMRDVLWHRDLASALDALPDGGDFSAWLALALQGAWIERVEVEPLTD